MATTDAYPDPLDLPADAQIPTPVECHRGVVERWRARKHTRLMSARHRRELVRWLRLTARHATDRDPIRRRHDVLLHYRAAAVRTDLLEIAALLERAHDPDPCCIEALQELLASGDSPLYHRGVHVSELYAALHDIRAGLVGHHTGHQSTERARPGVVRDERTNR
jgi:hypothetical protein